MKQSSRKKHRTVFVVPVLIALIIIVGTVCGIFYNMKDSSLTKDQTVPEQPIEDYKSESISVSDLQTENQTEESQTEIPEIVDVDLSTYFGEMNGCAVFYNSQKQEYFIYNRELADQRRSPCSTFKIISSLLGFKEGMIDKDHARTWSGEEFWNKDWNRDINFQDAFRTSCVWYFRELIDEIGVEAVQRELETLHYGNCDISDWEGRLNTNNNNRALTGFWIESSLLISPKEQTEVMERIFGTKTVYDTAILDSLKSVMLVDSAETDCAIYGKTGTGKKDGKMIDAWFTGFMQDGTDHIYFAVYLGESDQVEASSKMAKQIAIDLCEDYLNGKKAD